MADLTVTDLKNEISNYRYNVLTNNDDTLGTRALERARTWLTARLAEVDEDVDEEDTVVRQVLLKYALYELYSYGEQEEVASDKKDDALELLSAYVSRTAGRRDTDQKAGAHVAVVNPETER